MRGSRIQAIVRELNNEKIDIINYSEKSEILISRALSPAKPLDLYIDDDRKYCIAIFDDDELEFAIGRGGVNINLAAKATEYRIDAFGKKEYEQKLTEKETPLADIQNMPARAVKPLADNGVSTVSELLNSEEERLLEIKGIGESTLEKIYNAVQSFVEANQAEEKNEEEILVEISDSDNIEVSSKSEQNPDEKSTKKTPEEKISNEPLSKTNAKQLSEDKLEKVQS